MEIAACDPALKALLFFPLIDERFISNGFQSGDLFADLAQKQSYGAVKGKIASSGGNCIDRPGGTRTASCSRPHRSVVKGGGRYLQVSAGENVTASGQIVFTYTQTAARKCKGRGRLSTATKTLTQSFSLAAPGMTLSAKLKGPASGKVVGTKASVTLVAETNPERSSTLSASA